MTTSLCPHDGVTRSLCPFLSSLPRPERKMSKVINRKVEISKEEGGNERKERKKKRERKKRKEEVEESIPYE